uniref:Uncharacterized protein n=1 Tax=Melopsittacus undulatus TaxID=13146 RepID=A0A8V5FUD6_MELUD
MTGKPCQTVAELLQGTEQPLNIPAILPQLPEGAAVSTSAPPAEEVSRYTAQQQAGPACNPRDPAKVPLPNDDSATVTAAVSPSQDEPKHKVSPKELLDKLKEVMQHLDDRAQIVVQKLERELTDKTSTNVPPIAPPWELEQEEEKEAAATTRRGGKRQRCGGTAESRERAQRVLELTAHNERLRAEIQRLSTEVQRTRAALIDRIVNLRLA